MCVCVSLSLALSSPHTHPPWNPPTHVPYTLSGTTGGGSPAASNWTTVSAMVALPNNPAIDTLTVDVYARQGMTGVAWWRNVTLINTDGCCCGCSCNNPICKPPLISVVMSPA